MKAQGQLCESLKYRTEDGSLKCPIGFLIPDELIDKMYKNDQDQSIDTILALHTEIAEFFDNEYGVVGEEGKDFLIELQSMHDTLVILKANSCYDVYMEKLTKFMNKHIDE